MKTVLLMMGLCELSLTTFSQGQGRVRSGTPLRWGMNGSIEVMEGDLAVHYGSNDTAANYRRNRTPMSAAVGGNPHALSFSSVKAFCSQNSVSFSWIASQQSATERFNIEQSTDGINWKTLGAVPANRVDFGRASYNFDYHGNTGNAVFRITAYTMGGEKVSSSTIESPCSNTSSLAVLQNPVYSTTTVRIGSPTATRVRMMVVSSSGVVVQTRDAGLLQGLNDLPLDISALNTGLYTLYIQWRDGKQDALNIMKQ